MHVLPPLSHLDVDRASSLAQHDRDGRRAFESVAGLAAELPLDVARDGGDVATNSAYEGIPSSTSIMTNHGLLDVEGHRTRPLDGVLEGWRCHLVELVLRDGDGLANGLPIREPVCGSTSSTTSTEQCTLFGRTEAR
jgi:hypothetical protein